MRQTHDDILLCERYFSCCRRSFFVLLLLRFVFFYRYCFVFTYYVSARCTRIFSCIECLKASECVANDAVACIAFCSREHELNGAHVCVVCALEFTLDAFLFSVSFVCRFWPTVCARLYYVSFFFARSLFVSSLKMNVPVDFIGSPGSLSLSRT